MIKSVHKAMAILSVLSDGNGEPMSLAVISERAGINKSTCAHLIKTLEADGYAVKISSSRGYILGPAAYCLSRFGRYSKQLVSVARPVMKYLYQHSSATVVLAVLEANEKYILDYFDDDVMFHSGAKIIKDDIYRTATGRVLLSYMSRAQISEIVKKHGMPTESLWPEATDEESLLLAIERIRASAVVKSRGVSADTLSIGYGAPIFDSVGCIGAIGIAVRITPAEELEFASEEKKIEKLLVSGAKAISMKLQGLTGGNV